MLKTQERAGVIDGAEKAEKQDWNFNILEKESLSNCWGRKKKEQEHVK